MNEEQKATLTAIGLFGAIALYVFVILPEPPSCDTSISILANEYVQLLAIGAVFIIPNLDLVRGKQ